MKTNCESSQEATVTVRPRLLVTGASGFVGRHLLEMLAPRWQIFALDRRSRVELGIPRHPNIQWAQVDLQDEPALATWFQRIREGGGADALIHLAAYYNFSGDDHPEYWSTNVEGTRRLLELSRDLGLRRWFFTSSLAACRFPTPGEALTETSPPDGEHVYSVTKRLGEEMLSGYRERFPTAILRFPALFSDWCQYEPLFVFLDTWLSNRWNARILGGRGRSAVPYLHVRDVVRGMEAALERMDDLEPEEVLALSADGAVSHRELFAAATEEYYGSAAPKALCLPRPMCALGMWMRDLAGRFLGERPFERPWMARYIDDELRVDASRTRGRLGWQPRERLAILHRLPFLIENFKSDPIEWYRCNTRCTHLEPTSPNLQIYRLMEEHQEAIIGAFHDRLTRLAMTSRLPHYRTILPEEHEWNHRLVLQNLMNAIRTKEKGVFMTYCRNLAKRRYRQGFQSDELCSVLETLERCCTGVLLELPEAIELRDEIRRRVGGAVRFGVDCILDTFERLEAQADLEASGLESREAIA